jgi:Holliday junction resolvase
VEKYAENIVYELLKNQGYEVERFGKPFDLLAVKGSEVVKVEVKGKQQFASTVEVTINCTLLWFKPVGGRVITELAVAPLTGFVPV